MSRFPGAFLGLNRGFGVQRRPRFIGRSVPRETQRDVNSASASRRCMRRAAVVQQQLGIRLDPTSREAYCNLGFSYKDLDNQKAIESFKEAIRIKPDYDRARWNLGMAYVEVGDIENALKEYEILQKSNETYAAKLYSAINAKNE